MAKVSLLENVLQGPLKCVVKSSPRPPVLLLSLPLVVRKESISMKIGNTGIKIRIR